MEMADESETEPSRILDTLLPQPPRLEDAGLEDCALPPESIKEAFFKAASAVKSRAASIFYPDDCVDDPRPDDAPTDYLVGVAREGGPAQPCATEKGGGGGGKIIVGGGDVVVPGVSGGADEVLVGGTEEDGKRACVDGLQGLEIGDRGRDRSVSHGRKGDDEDDEQEEVKGILVEGLV